MGMNWEATGTDTKNDLEKTWKRLDFGIKRKGTCCEQLKSLLKANENALERHMKL